MSKLLTAAASAATLLLASSASHAQDARTVLLREGTEVTIEFEQKLSSATAADGDVFNISLADSVEAEGVKIPSGYSGRGEVVHAEKRGMMGRPGELNVRLNYIRIGDQRVKLRANKGGEGKSGVGATVALTVLFGPLGLLKHGSEMEIQRGQHLTAFIDEDVKIGVPVAPPPNDS